MLTKFNVASLRSAMATAFLKAHSAPSEPSMAIVICLYSNVIVITPFSLYVLLRQVWSISFLTTQRKPSIIRQINYNLFNTSFPTRLAVTPKPLYNDDERSD